jgi:hypothetical protein
VQWREAWEVVVRKAGEIKKDKLRESFLTNCRLSREIGQAAAVLGQGEETILPAG